MMHKSCSDFPQNPCLSLSYYFSVPYQIHFGRMSSVSCVRTIPVEGGYLDSDFLVFWLDLLEEFQ